MAYGKNYGGAPFVGQPSYNQPNRGYYPQNQENYRTPTFKKSGATYSKIGKGKFEGFTIVNAWNVSKRRGLITCTVAPYGKSKEYTGEQNGNTYLTMMAVVTFQSSGQKQLIPCSMNVKTKAISLSELGMVISPNGRGMTRTGKRVTGYFGSYLNK